MNKRIVVTGGTKGIGRAIIEKFAAEGFEIITCARNADDLNQLKKIIEKKYLVKVHASVVDVSKKNEVQAFGDFINAIGEVQILVNNAGIFMPGQVHDEADGIFEQLMTTNLNSAYYLTRKLIPSMKAHMRGHVFNMCSTASIMPYVNGGSYCISKYAMLGMTKVLREEMKNFDIKVTAIMPGATYTASWESSDMPEDRFMKSEDVADSVFSAYSLSNSAVVEEIIIRPQLGDI